MTLDELQRIDGIGAGIAKQIRWAVQENTPIYSSD